MDSNLIETIATNLRHHRMAARMNKSELASRTGLSRQIIYLLERGTHDPKIGTLLKISSVLGCSVEDLIYPARNQ